MARKKKEELVEEPVEEVLEENEPKALEGIAHLDANFNRKDLQALADKVNELVDHVNAA